MTEEWVDIARAGEYDDVPIYALADGTRIRVPSGLSPPDPSKVNVWLDEGSTPAIFKHWNGTAWVSVGATAEFGDLTHVYTQNNPEAIWEVQHNLGKVPTTDVYDNAGVQLDDYEVEIIDLDRLRIIHGAPVGGKSYHN